MSIGDGGVPTDDRGPARIETAYLQLVMKRLWDEEQAAGSAVLRAETLRRLGGADTIVRAHLDDVMAELPGEQRDAAAAALRFLVTSNGRKIALSSEELREFSDAAAGPLEPALDHLERERILRADPLAGARRPPAGARSTTTCSPRRSSSGGGGTSSSSGSRSPSAGSPRPRRGHGGSSAGRGGCPRP